MGIIAFIKRIYSERGRQETLRGSDIQQSTCTFTYMLSLQTSATSVVSFMFADSCFCNSFRLSLSCRAFIVKTVTGSRFRCVQRVFHCGHKNCEIKETDSAQNNSKPLETVRSIASEMGLWAFSPGCRTFKRRYEPLLLSPRSQQQESR